MALNTIYDPSCWVILYISWLSSLQFSNKSRLFSLKDRPLTLGRGQRALDKEELTPVRVRTRGVGTVRLHKCHYPVYPAAHDRLVRHHDRTTIHVCSALPPAVGCLELDLQRFHDWVNPEDWIISKGIFRSCFSILTSTSCLGFFVLKDKSSWKTRCQLPGALRLPGNRKQWRHSLFPVSCFFLFPSGWFVPVTSERSLLSNITIGEQRL